MSQTTKDEMTFTIQCEFRNGVYEDGPGVLNLTINVETFLEDVVEMLAAKHDLSLGPSASRQLKAALHDKLCFVTEPTPEMIEAGVGQIDELGEIVGPSFLVSEIFKAMLEYAPRSEEHCSPPAASL